MQKEPILNDFLINKNSVTDFNGIANEFQIGNFFATISKKLQTNIHNFLKPWSLNCVLKAYHCEWNSGCIE